MMMQSRQTIGQNKRNSPQLTAARSIRKKVCRAAVSRGLLLLILLNAAPVNAQGEQLTIELSPLVTRLLEDDLLTETQRREAMIFHGQWEQMDDKDNFDAIDLFELNVARHDVSRLKGHERDLEHLFLKLIKDGFDFDMDAGERFDDLLFAISTLHFNNGQPQFANFAPNDFDHPVDSPRWRLLFAQAYEDLGQYPQAIEQLAGIREQAQTEINAFKTGEDLTAAAEAVIMLARLEGRPAADFHLANQLLSKAHEEVDPLYWPAYVAEAELLMSKGNPQQAIEAVLHALSLNPKSSEAWYLFGAMQTRFFNFDAANQAVKKLREINNEHPLADALAVQVALRQKDMTAATETIDAALERYPTHRLLLSLNAAVQALLYDDGATQQALATFAELAPNNPLAEFWVGQALTDARQYALAEPHLKAAIKMLPGWSEPQLAFGELYMQWGKLDEAAAQLQTASSLDPFHKAITNQLTLSKEMLGYATIETDQFVVRYLPGVDEVLARDVALHMGEMVDQFIERFQHDPPALTQVDLMPDDQHFAVRITGMPDIWTIAACTGDVIAMTPPRPGPKRAYGVYNWLNVMGHEYAHVVNLSQTNNRVPHWFTEGCAVRMETTGRLWTQYTLLARMYNTDGLFTYDELNWGFIRPTEEHHRPLAYAQSAWIKQYIEEEHGWDKALAMLDAYERGVGEHETIQAVFGFDHDELMRRFHAWAGGQVQAWGLATYGVEPEDETVKGLLATEDLTSIDIAELDRAINDHPGEPALLRLKAQVALAADDDPAAVLALKAYQQARPVDPWADRELARIALGSGDAETAIASLLTLDRLEGDAPEYAVELARVYRGRKDYDRALHFAERALLREPYNATYRESAATIALQNKDLDRAVFHVESLELLEPERAIHPKRLAVIYQRLGREDDALAAQERAKSLESLD